MKKKILLVIPVISAIILLFPGCKPEELKIVSGNLEISIDQKMHTAVNSKFTGASPFMVQPQPSEYLVTKHMDISDFAISMSKEEEKSDSIGQLTCYTIIGNYNDGNYSVEKQLIIRIYNDFPGMAVYSVSYTNTGNREIQVKQWHYQ
jgi:hypothetical protein